MRQAYEPDRGPARLYGPRGAARLTRSSTVGRPRGDDRSRDQARRRSPRRSSKAPSGDSSFARGSLRYDEHRKVWNGSIDRSPALIARCAGVADVIAAVRFAQADRPRRSPSAAAATASPATSVCDGGIVIDLGPMKGIRVDPEARTARAQAGVLLGELDRETQAFGLAAPAGIVTHTGVAGLTLGGGIGWLMRKHGLTIDQLLSRRPGHRRRRVREGERDARTPTSSGACAAAAATSASSPSSSSASTRSARPCSPDRSSGRWRSRRRCCASTATGSPRRRTS